MFFGRFTGWTLVGLALLMASGDAVLALGPSDHVAGIVTGDIWTLLAGRAPHPKLWPALSAMLLAWPAWTLIAPVGIALLAACRPRRRRHFRSTHHFG